jgi:hypothetical protein
MPGSVIHFSPMISLASGSGFFVWGGLWFRDTRIQSLMPFGM